MCACACEKKCKLGIVLLPEHQPVALQVALPRAGIVARQFVWALFAWQPDLQSAATGVLGFVIRSCQDIDVVVGGYDGEGHLAVGFGELGRDFGGAFLGVPFHFV